LYDLLRILYLIYPKAGTVNRYMMRLPAQYYPPDYEDCHRLLTHFITLIHMPYRIVEQKKYVTEKEDVLMSLQMLEIVSLKTLRSKEERAADFLLFVERSPGQRKEFTCLVLRNLLQQPKTTVHNKIQLLIECGYAEKTGGYKNRGYIIV